MANPNITEVSKDTQWKPGESGNPAGKPKGTKHLSTWIQELGEDPEFKVYLQDPIQGYVEYKGAPIKAVVEVAWRKAATGDKDAREWLAKHGWKQQVDVTTNGKDLPTPILGGNFVPGNDSDDQTS